MMWRGLILIIVVGGSAGLAGGLSAARAQTGLITPQSGSSPAAISPIQPSSAPTSGLPANILTPSTTSQLAPSAGASPSIPPPFTSAGRGLPGMQGGPPLNAPMGAQDPSRNYMQPPTVGPLFCDPALNIQC